MDSISIIPYRSDLQPYFELINKEWVNKYFTLEPFDILQLEDPDQFIIQRGGAILFARIGKEVIGTIGLIKTETESVYELIKMGVLPKAQGKGAATHLIRGIIDEAKSRGAKKIILYSNSKLVPALSLYRKLGFVEVNKECGKYTRCDVKMEFAL